MRKLIACGVVLVAALALTVPGAFGGAEQTPGAHRQVHHHRRDVPAHRPRGGVRADPARHEGVLRLRQRPRTGPTGSAASCGRQIVCKYYNDDYNPAEHGQLTRRLVEQDKVFATVGQLGTEMNLAVRRVPEPAEGAADARLDRRVLLGQPGQGVPVDDRLAARLHRRGPAVRAAHQGEPRRQEDRRSCTRTTTTARTTSTGSATRSASSTPTRTSSPEEAYEVEATSLDVADAPDQGERRPDPRAPEPADVRRSGRSRRRRRSASTRTRST